MSERASADLPQIDAPAPPKWRRALPFVLAFALLAFMLARLDLRAFVAELGAVNAPAFLLFSAGFIFVLLSADTWATVVVYRRAALPVRFRDLWVLRGASYLPSMINHHVGQAFVTYFLARAHRVSFARAAGATLLGYASWSGCILGIGCLALWVEGGRLGWIASILGAGVLYLVIIALRPAMLARTKLLSPLFEAGVSGHIVTLLSRLPHAAVLFLGTWLSFGFFGVDIPVGAALKYVPILMVAATLPITPQGFGTRDVLASVLFERFATGATHEARLSAIAAATMSFGVAITLWEALLGLLLLRRAMPEFASRQAA